MTSRSGTSRFSARNRALHGRVRVRRLRAGRVLAVGQPEEQDAWHAIRLGRRRFLHGLVDRELVDAGHGADLAAHTASLADEERQDEAVGRQPRFAHEAADGLAAAKPARGAASAPDGRWKSVWP